MAKQKGTLIIDDSIPKKDREEVSDRVLGYIDQMKTEVSERQPIIEKRQDFFEGRHHRWTNVVGQSLKQSEGHILAVFNYIYRFCQKLHQSLTNSVPRIKVTPKDEANELETVRSEAVEKAIYEVLRQNKFFSVIFKRSAINQIRDGDFLIGCTVQEDEEEGRHIEIKQTEDMVKALVLWDDAAGSSFTGIAFRDMWSLAKIKREFNYDAEPFANKDDQRESKGSHANDQYGQFASAVSPSVSVPTGQSKMSQGEVVDYWGYEVIKGEIKVVNIVYINKEMVQFVITDYRKVPKWVGHSFISAGKPWSVSFIDPLVDPQIELNDRTGEEGDLIRIGANMKFVVVNMPDFDPDSIRAGTGQVIFIEGENADFRPLNMNISPFPSETYINRVLDHMFNLGLPKIALSAGTAPYTGRVGAIQYQPVIDFVADLRTQWEVVMDELIRTIQQYFIDYFPELHPIMREHILDEETGESRDGDFVIRDISFDWDNVLPLSRSDKVVDASTIYDRHAISTHTYLEQAGFRDPSAEIKKLKAEAKDPDMMTLREKFSQFAKGAVSAQLDAQKAMTEQAEQQGLVQGQISEVSQGSKENKKPLLTPEQNTDRRGVASSTGTPTGQTASAKGAVDQVTQNLNAQSGV